MGRVSSNGWRLAGLVLFSTGCFDLPEIELGMCGNGLVEPSNNEDCDVAEDRTLGENLQCGAPNDPIRRCRYLCGSTPGAPSCPVGWRCGADDVCLYASGTYREIPTPALSAPAQSLDVGDVDGDGRADLVALTNVGLTYRFSNASGLADEDLDLPFAFVPWLEIEPVLTDLDADGLVDVVTPLADGVLVLRGARDRLPAVVQYPSWAGLHEGFRMHSWLVDDVPRLLGSQAADGRVCLTELDQLGSDPVPCARADISLPVPDGLDGNLRTVVTSTTDDLVIVVHGDTTAYRFAPQGGFGPPEALELGGAAIDRARFFDLDGDGDGDLLIDTENGPVVSWRDGDDLGAPVPTGLPWPLDVGDVDGDGRPDVLRPRGVYLATDVGYDQIYQAPEEWTDAVFGDFNGDGRLDVAATGRRARIRTLLNAGGDLFNPVDLVTDAPVRALTVAELDGDRVDDLAFVQDELEDVDDPHTSIGVMYGNGFAIPDTPVDMGRISFATTIERTQADQLDINPDRIEELLVGARTESDGTGAGSYTFLSTGGSTIRRLGSILAPAPNSIAIGVVALSEASRGLDVAPTVDFIVLTTDGVYLARGAGGTTFRRADIERLDLSELCDVERIDVDCLEGAPMRLSDRRRDSALLVDGCSGRLLVLTEAQNEYQCQVGPAQTGTAAVSVADFDRNGRPEALIVTDGEATVRWNYRAFEDGGGFVGETKVEVGSLVSDIVALDVDADASLELMVVTADGLLLGDLSEGEGFVPRAEPVLGRAFSPAARVVVADLTGDGVQDVIVSDGAVLITLIGAAGQGG